MPSKKLESLPKLKNKVMTAFQRLVRLKWADDEGYCTCVTCGVIRHFSDNMHAGHFLPRSSSKWALDQRGCAPQCAGCNMFKMNSSGVASQQYTIWMIDRYGREFVDHMIATKGDAVKRTRADYLEILDEIKEQIATQEQRLGIGG
jgi:hypothetical protein